MVWGFGFGGQFKGRGPPPIPNTWVKKIENFFYVSNGFKMILKGFRTCFEDFLFSRSANPLHDPCIRYGGKKSKFFFCFLCSNNDFNRVLDVF